MPRSRSVWSEDANMNWLDITRPERMSSGGRLETTVTSWPSASRPSASCRPAWPPPTIKMLLIVRLLLRELWDCRLGLLRAHRRIAAVDRPVGAGHERRLVAAQ